MRAGNKLDPNTDADVITDEVVIGNMRVQRIDTPHDAAESCCYRVTAPDGKSALIFSVTNMITQKIGRAHV